MPFPAVYPLSDSPVDGPVRPARADRRGVQDRSLGHREPPLSHESRRVWSAAAMVESCQWEMDRAVNGLHSAIRAASASGMDERVLAHTARIPVDTLKAIPSQEDG